MTPNGSLQVAHKHAETELDLVSERNKYITISDTLLDCTRFHTMYRHNGIDIGLEPAPNLYNIDQDFVDSYSWFKYLQFFHKNPFFFQPFYDNQP